MLLDTYAPLKRVQKYKLKFKSKPWITLGLQKSISVKNKLLTNFINKKDPIPRYSHTSHLFKQSSILKFQDKICLENILFISKSLNNLSTSVFNTWFSFSSDQHNYETSSSTQGNLTKLFYKTNKYGKYSITVSAVESWNKIQKQLKNILIKDLPPNKTKTAVSNFYFKSY